MHDDRYSWAGNISGKECGNEKEFYSMADAFGCDHAFPAMVSRDICKRGCGDGSMFSPVLRSESGVFDPARDCFGKGDPADVVSADPLICPVFHGNMDFF